MSEYYGKLRQRKEEEGRIADSGWDFERRAGSAGVLMRRMAKPFELIWRDNLRKMTGWEREMVRGALGNGRQTLVFWVSEQVAKWKQWHEEHLFFTNLFTGRFGTFNGLVLFPASIELFHNVTTDSLFSVSKSGQRCRFADNKIPEKSRFLRQVQK